MNSEREQAYLNLINQLLTCPSGEEAEVLETHPELLDDGLVAAMLEEAENLRRFGELNNANRLMNCAGILLGMNDNTSVAVTRQAEADRLLEQGIQQFNISQVPAALQSWEQALMIYREIGYREGEAMSLGILADAYQSLGQYHRAIEFLKQSSEISREIGYRQGEAACLGSLGNAYNCLGQFRRAIEFHQQSLEIYREIGNRAGEAISLGNMGIAYQFLKQLAKAIKLYKQYLEISRKIGFRQGEAISLGNLGNAYQSLQQLAKAIKLYKQSLEIYREIRDRKGEAYSLGNLGNAYQSLEQLAKAIKFHKQSLEIKRERCDRKGEANSLANLGESLRKNNQLAEAEIALRTSIKIRETLRSELVSNDHKASIFETQVSAYRLLQEVLVAQSKFDEALEISEMSRTRAFVELLRQTLLTTPPSVPPLSRGGRRVISIPPS